MFLDPRSDILGRLAIEEGQNPQQMMFDIATTLGICQRLYDELKSVTLPETAELDIRVFDEVPYFAYHKVDSKVIIGFYFTSSLGYQSAAYEVLDEETEKLFESHFTLTFARAQKNFVLRIDPHRKRAELNKELLVELKNMLENTLGESETVKAMAQHA